jgi:3-deoxy-D-manno-octulosonate 8-phosphate phosphatase (KDO 8-P phosphatase)|tara:strand:- start:52 stop:582 length:531 start_codon:yes stop_codon:yes gene_type:complete
VEKQALLKTAADIQMVVFDVDGVFTDGSIMINHLGEETKSFNVRDGHGVRMLIHYGIQVAVLSGRKSKAVDARMQELGVTDVMQGHIDKRSAFTKLVNSKNLPAQQVAFVGDDIIDVPAMQLSGLSFAVADAHEWVKSHADHITQKIGGHGAVREVCELILDSKGLLTKALNYNVQ